KSANIKLAAKRIVFGKFINCGQTCVAPDYIYCHKDVKAQLVEELKKQIVLQYGEKPLENEAYGKIINEKHFDRICRLIPAEKVVIGGGSDKATLKIEPTIINNATWDDAVMQEEIFGPVLPILTYEDITDVAEKVNSMDSPLALYIFASDKKVIKYVTSHIQYGGGCVNDTIVHLATTEMGFGGVGASGMGSYHGKHGFDTFTHYKSIMDKKTFLDLPMRYQPYNKLNDKLIKMFLK
ncbi:MAG: aldehyde dehydrogenase family protein, partial [Clostridia bacterium]|nr:aldehyde dehydrogenase family protein [Clostridia bacterium]